ncbi:Hsp70 family protein [Celeribacter sp.]|uniref:Hsp70 family protein n=1 Tax=Celeribacter sp. TaxID=1890673 RepID=UPI003A92B106
MATLGIDFGTSNTAAGWMQDGAPVVIPLEGENATLPTAIFLEFGSKRTLYGQAAARAMMDGEDGRFMRALKSVLGTPLAQERRQFMAEKLTLIEVIARFLSEIKARAEAATGETFDAAISGRPVRFHSVDADRDAQALVDLTQAYEMAGFGSVFFLPEPEAAALSVKGEGRILIVDIGGGTSDFTICEKSGLDTRVIASEGIRLGGTDFDKQISLSHIMPLLGLNAQIGNEFGEGSHSAPRGLYNDLASWEKITFVYGDKTVREVRRWERLAREPKVFGRLADVLEMHLGHDVAYAVEAGKITANGASEAMIDLGVVEKGLGVSLPNGDLMAQLFPAAQDIALCAEATLKAADMTPDDIDRVVFVGGSSLLGVIQQRIGLMFPNAAMETSEVFTAVVDGLAIAAGARVGA